MKVKLSIYDIWTLQAALEHLQDEPFGDNQGLTARLAKAERKYEDRASNLDIIKITSARPGCTHYPPHRASDQNCDAPLKLTAEQQARYDKLTERAGAGE